MKIDPKDGGGASRKLWFSVGIGSAITGAWLCTGFFATLRPTFETLVGALLGLTGIYLTGNVASKFVIGKVNGTTADAPEAPAPTKAKTKRRPGETEEGG